MSGLLSVKIAAFADRALPVAYTGQQQNRPFSTVQLPQFANAIREGFKLYFLLFFFSFCSRFWLLFFITAPPCYDLRPAPGWLLAGLDPVPCHCPGDFVEQQIHNGQQDNDECGK